MDIQKRIEMLYEQSVSFVCESTAVDLKLLKEATGGKVHELNDSESMENAKAIANSLRWLMSEPPKKPKGTRRGRPAATAAPIDPNAPVKRRRGRKPKAVVEAEAAAVAAAEAAAVNKDSVPPPAQPETTAAEATA